MKRIKTVKQQTFQIAQMRKVQMKIPRFSNKTKLKVETKSFGNYKTNVN